ncbi:MAG: Tetratricopeptide domain protein [Pedosphaera sp.]|nr:Tetratricopeptide domain protein [Pedosphaera sp.]
MSADIEMWPPPNDPDAFESLCLDLWKEIWNDPGAQKNGRSGQSQAGVDVFGMRDGQQVGIQCKQKNGLLRTKVTATELEQEVKAAKDFRPKLITFILATTGERDAHVQECARRLSVEHRNSGLFSVEVWSWKDIWSEVYQREELLKRIGPIYWPRLAPRSTKGRNIFAIVLIVVVTLIALAAIQARKDVAINSNANGTSIGFLKPLHPETVEPQLAGQVGVVFDNNAGILKFYLPVGQTILPFGNNVPFWITKTSEGILISGEFKSMDGKVIAELANNEWRANPHSYFKLNSDSSALEVIDDYNIPWLHIEYLTPTSLKIGGVFRSGDVVNQTSYSNFTNSPIHMSICQLSPGVTTIIGEGQTTMWANAPLGTEGERQAFAKEVRELVQLWFDYSPSKGKGFRIPEEPKVQTNPLAVKIPASVVSGTLRSQAFSSDRAQLWGRTLTLGEGEFGFPSTGVVINLPLEWNESVIGKVFTIPGQTNGTTSVQLFWKEDGAKKNDFLMKNYVMRLEFGAPNGNIIPGKIYLESSRKHQTKLAGTFKVEFH